MGRSSGPLDGDRLAAPGGSDPAGTDALARVRAHVEGALSVPLLPLSPWAGTAAAPGRQAVLDAEAAVLADLVAGRAPAKVEQLRFEAYRLAAVSWEDRWAYGRVARAEELIAEGHRQAGRWTEAWLAWRSSWWIRQTLRSPGAPERHRVMALLHLKLGRTDDARTRLQDALEGATGAVKGEAEALLQLLAVVDGR